MKPININESNLQAQAGLHTQENENRWNLSVDDDSEDHGCPACGAPAQFQKGVDERVVWMGIGETENCRCGAEYVHRLPICRISLNDQPLRSLLQMANAVEWAYADLTLSMSQEQIAMNRAYFGRIASAISNAKHDHIFDRRSKSEAVLRYREGLKDPVPEATKFPT